MNPIQRPSLHRCLVLALGLGLVLALGTVSVPGPRAEEPVTLTRLNVELLAIQNYVRNAGMKLKNGISGGTAAAGGDSPTSTPGRVCCSTNIGKIREFGQRAMTMIEALSVRYERDSNRAGIDLLSQMRENLIVVAQGVSAFETAASVGRAQQALAGLTRPVIRIREAAQGLAVCCSDPVEPEPAKKSKKKKKKRDQ